MVSQRIIIFTGKTYKSVLFGKFYKHFWLMYQEMSICYVKLV